MTGRHSAPSEHHVVRTVVAGGLTLAATTGTVLAVAPGTASAATSADWDKVAVCESTSNWAVNTGNGFFGGLQFTQETWKEFGGLAHAPRADLATVAAQKSVADKVLAVQGWKAWPVCSKKAGVTGEPTTPGGAHLATAAPAHAATPAPAPAPAHGGNVAVQPGDTLGAIGARVGETWQHLYADNVAVIGSNPNLIQPGQQLTTTATAAPSAPSAPAPAPVAAPAVSGRHALPVAHILNSFGPVKSHTQDAADQVVADVPGADHITLGGTRASAVDPNGHPSGRAVDYMVLANRGLGDTIVAYHIAHWHELGVEYVIYRQRILTSPGGAWQPMPDRGNPTANHMDHVHVNYLG